MRRTSLDRFLPAVVTIGVVLGSSPPSPAQQPPGLSSGSGAGTGAGGTMGGIQRNQTGSMSGVGPDASGGFGANDPGPFPIRRLPPGVNIPAGPGVDVTFPDDPALVPFLTLEATGGSADGSAPTLISSDILRDARAIQIPSERSMAFQLIAKGAIYSNQFSIAHQALKEASSAAVRETTPLTHDLRLMAIVTTYTNLTDAVLREGRDAQSLDGDLAPEPEPMPEPDADAEPLPKKLHGKTAIRMARHEWDRAAFLARRIHNPTNRNEMLFRLVESQALGSVTIASGYGQDDPTLVDAVTPTRTPKVDPAVFTKLADEVLEDAVAVAKKIEWPVWKGKALIRVVMGAADSYQFERGMRIARSIDDPEYRTEALLFLAEAQCRLADQLPESPRRDRLNQEATRTYTDVAQAVSEVRQMGLRGVGVGFLVDSLISVGRFDDARACVALYPERYQQFVALGAIAESQGRRGSADAAREWIARDTPDAYKPALYRRVTRGTLDAIEQNRSQETLRNDLGAPR
jgi:hypothetical protein